MFILDISRLSSQYLRMIKYCKSVTPSSSPSFISVVWVHKSEILVIFSNFSFNFRALACLEIVLWLFLYIYVFHYSNAKKWVAVMLTLTTFRYVHFNACIIRVRLDHNWKFSDSGSIYEPLINYTKKLRVVEFHAVSTWSYIDLSYNTSDVLCTNILHGFGC